jgi:hypothetical protein
LANPSRDRRDDAALLNLSPWNKPSRPGGATHLPPKAKASELLDLPSIDELRRDAEVLDLAKLQPSLARIHLGIEWRPRLCHQERKVFNIANFKQFGRVLEVSKVPADAIGLELRPEEGRLASRWVAALFLTQFDGLAHVFQ